MSVKITHRCSRRSALFVPGLLLGCTATELSVPQSHPGNPLAPAGQVAFATPLAEHGSPAENSSKLAGDPAPAAPQHQHSADATAPMDTTAPATKYTCVMHPEIVRDQPGNCPICGMKLVPKKEGK